MTSSPGLDRLGWDERWERLAAAYAARGLPGRVTAPGHDGVYLVACEEGMVRVTLGGTALSGLATDPVREPCTGDWAVVRHWPDGPTTLEQLLPRINLVRPRQEIAAGGRPETARVANVDVVAVLVPTEAGTTSRSVTDRDSLRRRLTAAQGSGTRTVLLAVGPRPEATVARLASLRLGTDVFGCEPAADRAPAQMARLAPAGTTALLWGARALCSSLTGDVAPSVLGLLAAIPGGGLLIHPHGS